MSNPDIEWITSRRYTLDDDGVMDGGVGAELTLSDGSVWVTDEHITSPVTIVMTGEGDGLQVMLRTANDIHPLRRVGE